MSLRWTLPFGAGTFSRACSYPEVGTLPYSFRESQRGEHPRTWRGCLGPVVGMELDSGQGVCLSAWEKHRQTLEYFKCPWALRGKAKGKVVPALLLQERTCRGAGGTSPCVKATLIQLQGGAAQLERWGQHWNSSWRAGAAQTPTQKAPSCWSKPQQQILQGKEERSFPLVPSSLQDQVLSPDMPLSLVSDLAINVSFIVYWVWKASVSLPQTLI